MIKNYFRILKKPHAYLQTILKTPVKFQKDRTETVGGVKGTKYLLKTRNHAPRATHHAPRITHHAPRKTKNCVPPLFFEKAGDNKNIFTTERIWYFHKWKITSQRYFYYSFRITLVVILFPSQMLIPLWFFNSSNFSVSEQKLSSDGMHFLS